LRAGVEWDKVKLDLFVDNVTDKRAIIANTNALSFNVATFNRVATNQPRTIGMTLSYNFGR
jgi:outer membrane receptor protein involved in Fe transport